MFSTKKYSRMGWFKILMIACILLTQVFGMTLYANAAELNLTATVISDSQIKLDWNTLPDAAYYKIYWGDNKTLIKTIDVNKELNFSSYTHSTGLEPETTYTYTVEALNKYGNVIKSSWVSVTTPKIQSPTILSGAYNINTGQITLNWKHNSSGVSGTVIRRSDGSIVASINGSATSATFTDDQLKINRESKYTAQSSNSKGGMSENSQPFSIFPIAPPNVSASVKNGTVTISWDNTAQISSFILERSKYSGSAWGSWTVVNNGLKSGTSSVNDTPDSGGSFRYRLSAKESGPYSGFSNITDRVVKPAPPKSLSGSMTGIGEITLNWTNDPSNESELRVERRKDSGAYETIAKLSSTTTKYTDKASFNTGSTYYYVITAYDSDSNRLSSPVWSIVVMDPSTPSSLTATTVSSSQIDLAWTYPGSQTYSTVIERRKDWEWGWTAIATVKSGILKYSDTGLEPNTKYHYRVKAVLGSNTYSNPYPNDSEGKSALTKLNKPTGLTGKPSGDRKIDLSWTDNSDETGFVIERKTDGGSYSVIYTTGPNTRYYQDRNLNENTFYTYRVKAVTSNNTSDYSNEVRVAASYFVAPSDLYAEAFSESEISLTWKDNAVNETNYEVWRKRGSSGNWKKLSVLKKNTTNFTDEDLDENTQYYYKVRAVNTSNNKYTDYSNEASARTIELENPDGLHFEKVSDTRITLRWNDNSDNEDGFLIERRTKSSDPWEEIGSSGKNSESFSVKNLKAKTTYYFRVKAYINKYNRIAVSEEIQVNTGTPEPPSDLVLKVLSPYEIRLRWDDNSDDETGFIIERSKDNDDNFKEIDRVDEDDEDYIDSSVRPNTKYYYRVVAYNKYGKSSYEDVEFAYTGAAVTFKDIGGSFIWAKEAIEDLAGRGIIKGKSSTIFAPGDTITRAEFTCLMLRAFELNTEVNWVTAIDDVKSDKWFFEELMVARKLGIIKPDSKNRFYPERPITREEMCVIIVKTLDAADKPLPYYSSSVLKKFVDTNSISSEALYSVASLVGEGIMNGKPGNKIGPKDTSNRAEAAALIYRVYHLDD